ncbi:MAG: NYN domain-containing protein [bacterium]|nr:NYN domain-containing protein [bacterium]
MAGTEPLIAVFCDFENLAIGARRSKLGPIKIDLVLKRLLEKGRIVYKRAYCDWSGYQKEGKELHRHGVEMVEIPQTKMSGKNSADIHMVVDALDLCYAKQHIDIFALLSGDSDFSPLVAKLKENDKRVISCGVKSSTSDLLVNASDEFLYYDDLVRAERGRAERATPKAKTAKSKAGASKAPQLEDGVNQVFEIVQSLAGDYDQVWGSMVKQTVKRVYPGFTESASGHSSFHDLLEALEDKGLIELEWDEKRGNYLVKLHRAKRS